MPTYDPKSGVTDAPFTSLPVGAKLEFDLKTIRQAVFNAFIDAAMLAHKMNTKVTPIYKRENYRYYRGYKGGNLRLSFDIVKRPSSPDDPLTIQFKWGAKYASYLVERGIAGTARARTKGTDLLYPIIIENEVRKFLVNQIAHNLVQAGVPVRSVRVG